MISSLDNDNPQLNHALNIFINSHFGRILEGNHQPSSSAKDKGLEALKKMQLICNPPRSDLKNGR
jgi:hypothetical protein